LAVPSSAILPVGDSGTNPAVLVVETRPHRDATHREESLLMNSAISVLMVTTALTAQTRVSLEMLGRGDVDPQGARSVAPAAPAGPALHDIERRLIAATNAARSQHGLTPLVIDMGLMESARRHTAWMTNNRALQHSTAAVAENIALGQRSVAAVIQSWMSSSGHRMNILHGSYRRLGVAAYRTPEGTIYWCQQFAW
jgi:uncharacterized protein YkwD